jgi:hypothetical protein
MYSDLLFMFIFHLSARLRFISTHFSQFLHTVSQLFDSLVSDISTCPMRNHLTNYILLTVEVRDFDFRDRDHKNRL